MSKIDSTEEKLSALLKAATSLREAQRVYMADRGNDALGKAVGEAAKNLDHVIELVS